MKCIACCTQHSLFLFNLYSPRKMHVNFSHEYKLVSILHVVSYSVISISKYKASFDGNIIYGPGKGDQSGPILELALPILPNDLLYLQVIVPSSFLPRPIQKIKRNIITICKHDKLSSNGFIEPRWISFIPCNNSNRCLKRKRMCSVKKLTIGSSSPSKMTFLIHSQILVKSCSLLQL